MGHTPRPHRSKARAISRRAFLGASIAAPISSALLRTVRPSVPTPGSRRDLRLDLGFPDPARWWHGQSSVAASQKWQRPPEDERPTPVRRGKGPTGYDAWREYLSSHFPDLRRHFVFEYYPWYSSNPWQHWDESERQPPFDIAAHAVPLLGPYDSRDRRVLEQHARWIADAGVGAVNVSWWGKDSYPDTIVPTLMDVMRAHDLHVTFHLEPYVDNHAERYADDVLYLVKTYGDRRRWDCFLLLRRADGTAGPVFKSFRTILPRQVTDCHGVVHDVPDYAADDTWHRQMDRLRQELVQDFDHITLLADSLDMRRTVRGGFDGIAIYDNFVLPPDWRTYAAEASASDLLFSFNTNAGYDGIRPRTVPPESCYSPLPLEPPAADPDFSSPWGRLSVTTSSSARIRESFEATVSLQCMSELSNAQNGFFLTYVNSFNEWHEGTEFEPMKNARDLLPQEAPYGYHNVDRGSFRIQRLQELIARVS